MNLDIRVDGQTDETPKVVLERWLVRCGRKLLVHSVILGERSYG